MTTRISTLPSLATVTAATILPVVEGGATKRVTAAALATYITGTVVASSVPGGSSGYVQYNTGSALGGSSNLYWDNSNGRLGIGTTSPAQSLNIKGSGTQTIWVESTDAQKAILAISASDTSVALQSTYNTGGSAARPFIFYNISTALMTFDLNKTVALQGATSSAGTGIGFPATQSASNDANTLDDYEEGTWTPRIEFGSGGVTGITYNTRTGYYVKIGSFVCYQGIITLSNKGSSTGAVTIQGMPFSLCGSGNANASGAIRLGNTSSITAPIIVYAYNGINIFQNGSGLIYESNFANDTYMEFSISGLIR
jgi:hypothetical protein